jgi:hypothetical protein
MGTSQTGTATDLLSAVLRSIDRKLITMADITPLREPKSSGTPTVLTTYPSTSQGPKQTITATRFTLVLLAGVFVCTAEAIFSSPRDFIYLMHGMMGTGLFSPAIA